MKSQDMELNAQSVWDRFTKSFGDYLIARDALFTELDSESRLQLIRNAFREDQRILALELSQLLPASELQSLLKELLQSASYLDGLTERAQQMILRLPHDWLLENINEHAEPLLRKGAIEEYSNLLALYAKIDVNLARDLAKRAAAHSDSEVREIGEYYLESLRDR